VSSKQPQITVGVTTRNRPAALLRCLESLTLVDHLVGEIIVVDDSSDEPLDSVIRRVPASVSAKLRIVRQEENEGYIVARNTMAKLASYEYMLSMDDDAYVIDAEAIRQALGLMCRDSLIGAVAFAQAEADGSPWPAAMQPSPVSYTCYVPAFIGFAHLLRRTVFLELGGYQELFHYYGEEKDYCLRLLNVGYSVVYVPGARVAHVPDPSGRSLSRYLRHVVKNDCLSALFNEPLLLLVVSLPLRLVRYGRMRRQSGARDPGGMWWIVRQLLAAMPRVWRGRKPVRWASVRNWRRLRRTWPAVRAAEAV
jgi:GT2 family glycosyltransferase